MKKISIMGCGWLGLPLAKTLLEEGHLLLGSTTSEEKMETISAFGILPYRIAVSEEKVEGNMDAFLNGSEILILNIPPQMRKQQDPERFSEKIRTLLPYIENSTVKKVVFVSSTSVYGNAEGTVTEKTTPRPTTTSGKELLLSENILQSSSDFTTTVLRFGGLIGGDRHPVYSLSGRKGIQGAGAPVNLIHREDCIKIIKSIMDRESWGKVFNAVYPEHPVKKEYYRAKANELGLREPEFEQVGDNEGKVVDSSYVQSALGFDFSHPI